MSGITLDIFMLTGGGVLLYFGAEWLVAGAAGLARSLGVSALIIGLTVVAYGTSMLEVIVGMQAAIAGHSEIAGTRRLEHRQSRAHPRPGGAPPPHAH